MATRKHRCPRGATKRVYVEISHHQRDATTKKIHQLVPHATRSPDSVGRVGSGKIVLQYDPGSQSCGFTPREVARIRRAVRGKVKAGVW